MEEESERERERERLSEQRRMGAKKKPPGRSDALLFAVSSRCCAIVGIINLGISVFISPSRSVRVTCELIGQEAKRGCGDSTARMMAGSAAAACLRPSVCVII